MPADPIIAQAEQWLRHDPDPDTRTELQQLIDDGSPELQERFCGPLAFGTAGLRGIIGAGQSRMNRAVVRRTTAGLASYLLDHLPDSRDRGVVVGYDGRRMSRIFAEDAAGVLCAAGLRVHLAERLCPTPLVAYGVQHYGAAAGVMITASHNPPAYNGYKVYADNGAQIIPPADRLIAEAIEAAPLPDAIAMADLDDASREGRLRLWGADLEAEYLAAVAELVPSTSGDRSICMAYTALHGVGNRLLHEAFRAAGFAQLHTVAEQAEPDGSFPTVSFPNPEEKGALDLALARAREVDADLVIANDPDADRLAVAVRRQRGDYLQLSGNELGALLGHHVLTTRPPPLEKQLVVTTVVSSPFLEAMARALGAQFAATLTGFKWIANRALQLERQTGVSFAFGYEEALGYTVGTAVRDKDGISAALVLACLAAELRERGQTLLDRLDDLAVEFGLFASRQRAVVLPGRDGKARMDQVMNGLRANPPAALAGQAIESVTDCLTSERRQAGQPPEPIELPKSNVLIFELAGGSRAVVRPSGTEPKIKLYVDVRESVADRSAVPSARSSANQRLDELVHSLVEIAGLA